MSDEVVIVATGVANIASVEAGLRRIGAEPRLSESADDVREAQRVFLPGVGAFGAGIRRLDELGLIVPIKERVEKGRSTMAICLGLQLFATESEESPSATGLGLLPGKVERFRPTEEQPDLVVPQFGWNRVEPDSEGFVQSGWAYYANSFRLSNVPDDWKVSWSNHGGRFVAAIERDNVLACQFHPELSGPWGLDLLRRWFEAGGS
jgi:imidazole glycerol phosphate synthase glutamine amidotransferase subunit